MGKFFPYLMPIGDATLVGKFFPGLISPGDARVQDQGSREAEPGVNGFR
jgi:hypothetical protein